MRPKVYRTFEFTLEFQSTHSMKSETLRFIWCFIIYGFQSTHSMKSETMSMSTIWLTLAFQSTHSMKSETDEFELFLKAGEISIHSLNEEWDIGFSIWLPFLNISIHSLNEEWDQSHLYLIQSFRHFNPLTQWRVRLKYCIRFVFFWNFNPLTQWRVRLKLI